MFRDRATPLSPCCNDAVDWVKELGVPTELVGPNISGIKLLDRLEKKGKSPDHVLNYLFNQVLLDGDDELNKQWQNQTGVDVCYMAYENRKMSYLPYTSYNWVHEHRTLEEGTIDHLTMQIAKYNAEIKKSKEKCNKK